MRDTKLYEQLLGIEEPWEVIEVKLDVKEYRVDIYVEHNVPGAERKIVYDKYHIMSQMGMAVDTARRQEHKELRTRGDARLSRSRYLWLYAEENIPEHHRENFQELKSANLKTSRAWAIKESFREFWKYLNESDAVLYFKRWFFLATHSRIKHEIDVAYLIKRHFKNILTFFTHRITNASVRA